MSGLLGRDELLEAFGRLARHLRHDRVVGHVYLVGGAAMALAYDADRVTRDADSLIVDAHGPVTDGALRLADELDLPRSWLNEHASAYIPRGTDAAAPVVFDDPHLKVTAASPAFVLAVKARAARPRDLADITRLARLLDVTTLAEIVALHDQVFPGNPLPPRTLDRLRIYWEAAPGPDV